MLIIRPYPVIRVIAPLRKQLRIIKANLMTGHIPVTGEIIHHRSGMYRTVLLLIELIPVKYIASSPANLRTLLLFYKGSRIRKNAAVKKTIPTVQEKHILPLYFLNRLIHSIVNAAVRLLKKRILLSAGIFRSVPSPKSRCTDPSVLPPSFMMISKFP